MTQRRGRGDGSLLEVRPGVWRLRVYVGTDPVTHRPVHASRTVHGRKSDALKELRTLAKEVDDGQHKATRATTVAFLLREWEAKMLKDHRQTTREDYGRIIRNHLIPAFGRTELRKLNAYDIDEYFNAKREEGLKPRTVRLHHSVLSGALSQAVKWGWVAANVAKSATPPKLDKPDRVRVDVGEVRKLIEAASDDRELATAVMLAAITGARRGELCGLRWPDVDWEAGVLTICRQRVPVKGGDITGPLKRGDERRVSLGPLGAAVLARYRQWTIERAADLEIEPLWDGWLISRDCGQSPMNARGLGTSITELGRRVGVPVTPHAFRRFAATQMVAAGVDVLTAASRLGHDPKLMLSVYAAALPVRDRAAAEGLEELVLPGNDESAPSLSPGR